MTPMYISAGHSTTEHDAVLDEGGFWGFVTAQGLQAVQDAGALKN